MLVKYMNWIRFKEEDLKRLNDEKKPGCYGYVSVLAENGRWFAVHIEYRIECTNTYQREGISLSVYPYKCENPYRCETIELDDIIMQINDIVSASNYNLLQTKIKKALIRNFWREMIDPRRKQKIEKLAGPDIDLNYLTRLPFLRKSFRNDRLYLTIKGALQYLEHEIAEGEL